MTDKYTPIPTRTKLSDEEGFLSNAWRQFLNAIFADIYKRIDALETTSTDHEARITALEP